MKLWIDDVRPAPDGYEWCKSVNQAINAITWFLMVKWTLEGHNEPFEDEIEIIDIDHDAGEYVNNGGDYIKLLDWLEEMGHDLPIHIHSANPVGVENMRRIIQRNGWTEVK